MSEEIKDVVVEQVNITCSLAEDRLLLKIGMSNDIEINVWLTRRVVKILWQLLQDINMVTVVASTDSSQAQGLLQTFSKESATQKMDFSEEYKMRSPVNSKELLLAQDCHVVKHDNTLPTLEFICTNGRTINMALNQDLSLALIGMLQLSTKDVAWDLAFSEQSLLLGPAAAHTILH